jgi:Zn-dependent protease
MKSAPRARIRRRREGEPRGAGAPACFLRNGKETVEFFARFDIATALVQLAVLLFSLSLHEAAHAWMADHLGDSTARHLGRVSLNPVVHVDPIGTLLFPLLQFATNLPLIGWAKPVPINPSRLRNPGRDQTLVSLSGPGSNLLAAAVFFILLALLKLTSAPTGSLIDQMILTLSIPRHNSILAPLLGFVLFGLVINLGLALFNLLPVPPLDGHWMLYHVLPYNAARILERGASYGYLLLYGMMFLGVFRFIFIPVGWALSIILAL